MNEMHEKGEKIDHTRWRTQGLGRKMSGEGEECEWEEFGREMREFLSKGIGENEIEIALTLYIDKYAARWISRYWEVSRIKIS